MNTALENGLAKFDEFGNKAVQHLRQLRSDHPSIRPSIYPLWELHLLALTHPLTDIAGHNRPL